ncbi:hypothetical protein MUK42_32976 [Musa troglodytarum]|uniref:Uncharacterized protein n=1 Tax=Musa troglodytarum TaxID=320322 RepID=A0A9E7JT25_9LILI|nr:hypothetical protein MUK42_32976 [Musa troglodytarum]
MGGGTANLPPAFASSSDEELAVPFPLPQGSCPSP